MDGWRREEVGERERGKELGGRVKRGNGEWRKGTRERRRRERREERRRKNES